MKVILQAEILEKQVVKQLLIQVVVELIKMLRQLTLKLMKVL